MYGTVPYASYSVLPVPGLDNRQLVDLWLPLARADEVERLVVAAVLLARNERVDGHHARLVLRGDKHVLLVGLLQEQQHVTAPGEAESGKVSNGLAHQHQGA